MPIEYWEDRRAGLRQALCAWGIVLALVMLFQVAELIWPSHQPIHSARSANMQP